MNWPILFSNTHTKAYNGYPDILITTTSPDYGIYCLSNLLISFIEKVRET